MAMFGAFFAASTRLGLPDWMILFVVSGLLGVLTTYLIKRAMPPIRLFILGPILAGATRANAVPRPAPVGIWDALGAPFRQQAQIYSLRFLIVGCLVFGVASIWGAYSVMESHGSYWNAIFATLMAVDFGVMLVLKLRKGRSRG
jgi:hypothetical protein